MNSAIAMRMEGTFSKLLKLKKYIQIYTTRALFISFALLASIILQGQIKVLYHVTYKPDSNIAHYNVEEMSLKHFNNQSYYYNETKFKLDSIYDKVTADYLKTGVVPNVSLRYGLNFGIVKDFSTDNIDEIHHISGRNFIFKNQMKKFVWNIKEETKKIHNYNCRRATTFFGGRVWEAWFTNQIPISDGPYKFFGLPGLILELYDSKKDYIFTSIGIEKFNSNFTLPPTIIRTSEESFKRLKNKLIKNPAMFVRESIMRTKNVNMSGSDGRALSSAELYDKINTEFNEYIKSHNNPIEKGFIWIR